MPLTYLHGWENRTSPSHGCWPWPCGLFWSMEWGQSYIPSTVCVCVCVCVSSAPRPLEASDLHQKKNTNLSLYHRMSPVEQTHSLEPIPADLQTHKFIHGVVCAELQAAFSCSIIATKADRSGGYRWRKTFIIPPMPGPGI